VRFATVRMLCILLVACVLSFPETANAFSLRDPEQTGGAIIFGSSYDPQPKFVIVQLSLMALYDYEKIMPHRAPEPLRFKLEGSLGLADVSGQRLLASVNILALYYLRSLEGDHFRPYVEAGVGVVYSDFQVEGQGLRVNFNPQAGIGTEWQVPGGQRWYGALRAYHISNGHLHRDNRGINAVTLQLGLYF
jgi:lipid A 3-O-deacylase